MDRELAPATLLARAGKIDGAPGEPLTTPIVLSSAYHLDGDVEGVGQTYGRQANPNWRHLEESFAQLTGGEAIAFASGIAAASAAVEVLVTAGRPIAIVDEGYYGIRALAARVAERMDVELVLLPAAGDAAAAIVTRTAPGLVWLESPTNPGLKITDLRAVAEAALGAGARLVLDETLVTPLGRNPFEFGASAAIYSATKYISGHSDVLIGLAVTADSATATGLRTWRHGLGAIPGPFESWLCLRGMQTLDLRYRRQCENALAIARWLAADGRLGCLRYPGLEGGEGYELACRDMRLFGGVVVGGLADSPAADELVRRLRLFTDATSFGGTASTVDRRSRWSGESAAPGLLRFSIGCEAADDLIDDLRQALDGL